LDYLLLDTRSGASIQSGIIFREVNFTVVNCRLDQQNRLGLPGWFDWCRQNGKRFCVVAHAVPLSFPDVGRYRGEFQQFLTEPTEELIEVPYAPRLYFQETIATLATASDPTLAGVRDAYAKLTDIVVKGVRL